VGLKSFYRGQQAELHVAERLQAQGYQLLKQRYKIFHQEVDLVMKTPDGDYLLVEVKAVQEAAFLEHNLRARQMRGLRRVCQILREKGHKIQIRLAVVLPNQEIHWIDEIF
jgi:Holliday junction resolvase-like predicted endonuclease